MLWTVNRNTAKFIATTHTNALQCCNRRTDNTAKFIATICERIAMPWTVNETHCKVHSNYVRVHCNTAQNGLQKHCKVHSRYLQTRCNALDSKRKHCKVHSPLLWQLFTNVRFGSELQAMSTSSGLGEIIVSHGLPLYFSWANSRNCSGWSQVGSQAVMAEAALCCASGPNCGSTMLSHP